MKKLGRLYAVTDDRYLPCKRLVELVKKACNGGVDMVQFRIKDKKKLVRCVEDIKKITETFKIPLIINDFVDVALKIGADGVHVGREDTSPEVAKKVLKEKIVGVSSYDDINYALRYKDFYDYVSFSSPFLSKTKEKPFTNVETIEKAVKLIDKPVYVIGGINADNAKRILEIGVYGIAVSSFIFDAEDIEKNVKELRKIIDEFA